jgi:hypothetical protein
LSSEADESEEPAYKLVVGLVFLLNSLMRLGDDFGEESFVFLDRNHVFELFGTPVESF